MRGNRGNRDENRAGRLARASSAAWANRAVSARAAAASPGAAAAAVPRCEPLEGRRLFAVGDPVINEFVTKNDAGLTVADGSHPDWIEIFNPGPAAVNLAGWTLAQADAAGVPATFTFPATSATATTVAAGGYRLVYADNVAAGVNAAGEVHANFKLDKAGGSLALRNPGGTATSAFDPYPEQLTDVSYGPSGPPVVTPGTLFGTTAPAKVLVPSAALPGGWAGPGFDDSTWTPGAEGVGYETAFAAGGTMYGPLIGTDVTDSMFGSRSTALVRVPFDVSGDQVISTLSLNVQYEDGFVAYLNGQEVARSNAPGSAGTPVAFDAVATANRADTAALTAQAFDLSAYRDLLVDGDNVLAVQGLNDTTFDARFLVAAGLSYTSVVQPANTFFTTPTPGAANVGGSLGTTKDTKFSVNRGFYDAPVDVAITTSSVGASIRYTTDGTEPSATSGTLYAGPIHLTRTTALRAVAYQAGYTPSNVDTQTYLFTADVATQTVPSAQYPTAQYPAKWSTSFTADYNVDYGDVSAYQSDFAAGLRDPNVPTISIVAPPGSLFDPATGIYQNPVQEGSAWERKVSIELLNPNGTDGFQVDAGLRIQGSAARQPANQPKHSFRALFKSDYGDSKLDYAIFGPGSANLNSIVFRATYNNSWTHPTAAQRDEAEFARDAWNRATQAAMGQPAARQKFVQLYLNGLYWGLYDVTDRPDASWVENELGGDADQYEVVNAGAAVSGPPTASDPDGLARTAADWTNLYSVINNANISTPAGYANAIANWIDPVNLSDYIIQNFYAGNLDWDFHNYYAYRDTSATATNKGWRFVAWDSERTLESPSANITSLNTANNPTRIFRQLMLNPEFKLLFADRVHKAFFNDGALTPTAAGSRYATLSGQISKAVVDESARWGDYRTGTGTAYGKTNWTTEVNRLLNVYFPARTANTQAQFVANGWYPSVAAPEFDGPFGGTVPSGYQVGVTNSNAGGGVVYYTTDGSDPRLTGGAVSSTALTYAAASKPTVNAATRFRMRILLNGTWSAITDATFLAGPPPAVRVSELMYHARNAPTGSGLSDDDFDYVELLNAGTTAQSLAGFAITGGVTYTFPTTGSPTLVAAQRVIVAADPTAFASRYGSAGGATVMSAGYSGKLSNSGETITLVAPLGQAVESFTYADSWYPSTDGDGFALVTVDPTATDAVLSTAAGWRAGAKVDGSPGLPEPAPVYTGTTVGDGSAQRSQVAGLTLTFQTAVATWAAGAFAVTRRDGGAGTAVAVAAALSADGKSVVLSFPGTGVAGGSLADGVYDLVVRPTLVREATGQAGTAADATVTFHRFFADLDGDRAVGFADFNLLAAKYGKTVPAWSTADLDGDGAVGFNDFNLLAAKYGKTLAVPASPSAAPAPPAPVPVVEPTPVVTPTPTKTPTPVLTPASPKPTTPAPTAAPKPTLSVTGASVKEGTGGTGPLLTFTVRLSRAATKAVTVRYATGGGTATAGKDYVAASGTVTFAPGQLVKSVSVRLKADALKELDESLFLTLSNATGGVTIAVAKATGTIVNDD